MIGKMVVVLGLFLQLSPNVDCEKLYGGELCHSYGHRSESMQCVWLVKKGPGQKVLKGHMTHSLSWENNSVPVTADSGVSREGPYHAVGRSH